MVSAAKLAANRRNAGKSTGPRTADGKDHSRHNARTHGMTARSPLLPGEDADLLLARQRALRDDMQPRNQLEAELLDTVGANMFRADQSALAGDARASSRIRHDAREQAKKEKAEALKLGESLLWKPSLPLPSDQYSRNLEMPPVANVDLHPRHPGRLLLELEWTVAGCDWLLDRFGELTWRLNVEGRWRPADAFTMIRLTGKHAIDLEDNDDVARVLLCSLTLTIATNPGAQGEPFDWISALLVMLYSFKHEDTFKTAADVSRLYFCGAFKHRLAELPLASLAPEGREQARQWLIGVIEGQIKRVSEIRVELQEIADADEAEAPARLSYEIGPEGDKHRRYIMSNQRQVSKSVNDFLKARTMSETGIFDFVAANRRNRDEPSGLAPSVETGAEKPYDLEETRQEQAALDGVTPVDDDEQARPREATPASVDGEMPAPSHNQEASCDDDQVLRNEPNAEFVSGPLSVVRRKVQPIDEPGAPSATADERHDENLEAEIDRQKASKLLWDEVAMRAPIRAEDLRKMNEESRKDAQEARAADRRGKRSGLPGDRKTAAPSHYQKMSCVGDEILRNEANAVSDRLQSRAATAAALKVEDHYIDEPTDSGQLTTDKPAANHHANEAPDKGQLTTDKVAIAIEQNDGRREALAECAVRRDDERRDGENNKIVGRRLTVEQFRAMRFAQRKSQKRSN